MPITPKGTEIFLISKPLGLIHSEIIRPIGFSNSIDVCNRIVKGNLIDKINDNIK